MRAVKHEGSKCTGLNARFASSAACRAQPSAARLIRCSAARPAVVILPGLGNASGDYKQLEADFTAMGSITRVAQVRRIDWARNASGIVDPNYWAGTLSPTPTVNWCYFGLKCIYACKIIK